jgi:hypothetical protein
MMSRQAHQVDFQQSDDSPTPWEANVDGQQWQVRINDFPEEDYLYSLLVDGSVVEEFQDWPTCWTRPPLSQTSGATNDIALAVDPYQQREYDIELEKFERARNIGPSRLVRPAGDPLDAEPYEQRKQQDEQQKAERGAGNTPSEGAVWWKSVDELFTGLERQNARDLARAERRAAASGKEPFSIGQLEELLSELPGSRAEDEASLRSKYYVRHSQVRTLAEFAKLIRELEAWE